MQSQGAGGARTRYVRASVASLLSRHPKYFVFQWGGTMELILFWIAFAVVVGIWASKRGRSGVGWFFLALLISPLLAALFLAVTKNHATEREANKAIAETKVCPRCAERVKNEALVCRFCGFQFEPQKALQSKISAMNVR